MVGTILRTKKQFFMYFAIKKQATKNPYLKVSVFLPDEGKIVFAFRTGLRVLTKDSIFFCMCRVSRTSHGRDRVSLAEAFKGKQNLPETSPKIFLTQKYPRAKALSPP